MSPLQLWWPDPCRSGASGSHFHSLWYAIMGLRWTDSANLDLRISCCSCYDLTVAWLCQFRLSNKIFVRYALKSFKVSQQQHALSVHPSCSFVASLGHAHHSRPAENKAGNEAKWTLWKVISDWNKCAVCTEGRETCVHPLSRALRSLLCGKQHHILKSDMASLFFLISFVPSSAPTAPQLPFWYSKRLMRTAWFSFHAAPLMRFCQVNLYDKAGAVIRHPSSVPTSTFLFPTATLLITGFVATSSQSSAYKLLTLSFC